MKGWRKALLAPVLAIVFVLAITGVVLAAGPLSAGGQNVARGGAGTARSSLLPRIPGSGLYTPAEPTSPLSEAEKRYLVLLWEEEKLARDVYANLYGSWNLPVLDKIGSAEGQHMAAIEVLLDHYGLADRVASDSPGAFTDPDIQAAYTRLVAQGARSLTQSLEVGVAIETLDISDLQALLGLSTHADITQVAQNLLAASQNHLAAFQRLAR